MDDYYGFVAVKQDMLPYFDKHKNCLHRWEKSMVEYHMNFLKVADEFWLMISFYRV